MSFLNMLLIFLTVTTFGHQAKSINVFENILDPFSSDGCSLLKDGTIGKNKNLWLNCCIEHDIAYWQGGNYNDKKAADKELSTCIDEKTGIPGFGKTVYFGTRAGGAPNSPFSWRWGFGWRVSRGYQELAPGQADQVNSLKPELPYKNKIKKLNIFHTRKTISGDYCIDMALGMIINELNIDRIQYEIIKDDKYTSLKVDKNYGRRINISTNYCEEILTFDFSLAKPKSCEPEMREIIFNAQVNLNWTNLKESCIKK